MLVTITTINIAVSSLCKKRGGLEFRWGRTLGLFLFLASLFGWTSSPTQFAANFWISLAERVKIRLVLRVIFVLFCLVSFVFSHKFCHFRHKKLIVLIIYESLIVIITLVHRCLLF